MIEPGTGNLLEADAEALVNTVNTVGVMGKGIALQFRQAFPANFEAYKRACASGEVQPGRMFVVPTGQILNPKFIINFPTKRHWKGKSRLRDIEEGLADLRAVLLELRIESVAVPPLGCGNGGLTWSTVRPLIVAALSDLDCRVLLYEPGNQPSADAMPVRTRRPTMNANRAALLQLIKKYREADGYRQTKLEVQKSAYFLQVAGQPLGLNWIAHQFGPYAEKLNFVLQDMEGHFIRGYGDRSQASSIMLVAEAEQAVRDELAHDPETAARVERVRRLIDRFEWPYGMELLATVHWVAMHSVDDPLDFPAVLSKLKAWSKRKAAWADRDVQIAWARLQEQGWLQRTLTAYSAVA